MTYDLQLDSRHVSEVGATRARTEFNSPPDNGVISTNPSVSGPFNRQTVVASMQERN